MFFFFFAVYVISHWSEAEQLLTSCDAENKKDCLSDISYYDFGKRILRFLSAAATSSCGNLLEVVNFFVFISKRSALYVKSKTYYDMYLQQQDD